jgi:selenoprotein W-related protein
MLRAAWMAQELLTTFKKEVGEAAVFEVRANDQLVWSRADIGRSPEIKELKQRVCDVVAPE